VALDHFDEIDRAEARQRRAREMRVARQEVGGLDAAVGEVAASATRNADLLGEFGGVVEQQHAAAALAGLASAHHAGRACTDNDHIESLDLGQGGGHNSGNGAGYALTPNPANGGPMTIKLDATARR